MRLLVALDVQTITVRLTGSLGPLGDEALLCSVIERLFALPLSTNYEWLVLFEFVNAVTEHKTITPFAAHLKALADAYKRLFSENAAHPRAQYSFAVVAGLQFLRKVLAYVEAFPPDFRDFCAFSLIDSCVAFVAHLEHADATVHDEQNETMFVEYAETVLRFMQVQEVHDEEQLLALLRCPFVALQKTAYVGLRRCFERGGAHQHPAHLQDLLNSLDYVEREHATVRGLK